MQSEQYVGRSIGMTQPCTVGKLSLLFGCTKGVYAGNGKKSYEGLADCQNMSKASIKTRDLILS